MDQNTIAVVPVDFSSLNVIDSLFLLRDIINVLEATNVVRVGADGHAVLAPFSPEEVEALVPKVEDILRQHGVVIPTNVDRIVASLPFLLSLFGVK